MQHISAMLLRLSVNDENVVTWHQMSLQTQSVLIPYGMRLTTLIAKIHSTAVRVALSLHTTDFITLILLHFVTCAAFSGLLTPPNIDSS